AQKEAAKDDLNSQCQGEDGWHDDSQQVEGVAASEDGNGQPGNGEEGACDSGDEEDGSGGEAGFKRDVAEDAVEARVFGEESFGDGEDLGEDGEGDRLESQEHEDEGVEKGVHVEPDAVEDARAGEEPGASGEADQHEGD